MSPQEELGSWGLNPANCRCMTLATLSPQVNFNILRSTLTFFSNGVAPAAKAAAPFFLFLRLRLDREGCESSLPPLSEVDVASPGVSSLYFGCFRWLP